MTSERGLMSEHGVGKVRTTGQLPLGTGNGTLHARMRRAPFVLAVFLCLLLLAPQISPAMGSANPTAGRRGAAPLQSVPLTQAIFLRRGYYDNVEVDSFSSKTVLAYAESSDVPISTAVMTAAQYNEFVNNISDPISNSITYQNGTSVQNSVALQKGLYFLVFYSYISRAQVQFGYEIYPSTPYSYGALTPPLATGIASFGIYNSSGEAVPYEVKTGQIMGVANITSFQVNTPNAGTYSTNISGSTLQLNAILVVNDNGSSLQKAYWVQNTPDFVTAASKVSFGDEIWNNTDLTGFLSNQTVTSTNFLNGGFVSSSSATNAPGSPFVYNYSPNNQTYALPLHFGLLMTEAIIPKVGVAVQLGYRLLMNGSRVSPMTKWFDNITIHDTNVNTAYFDVTGNSTTPVGDFYDAELVFAGEANLESAHFTQLNATLGLFYQAGSSAAFASFPTYYGFAGDTGEAADDLMVAYKNGLVQVTPSVNPNYAYLGNASLSLDPATLHASLASGATVTTTTSQTSSSSSTTTSTSASSTSASSSTSSATTGTTSGSPSPGITTFDLLLAVGAAVVVSLIVGVILGRRHRPASPYAPSAGDITTQGESPEGGSEEPQMGNFHFFPLPYSRTWMLFVS